MWPQAQSYHAIDLKMSFFLKAQIGPSECNNNKRLIPINFKAWQLTNEPLKYSDSALNKAE
ncbi:hypothetical protein Pyn_04558 [Prunus yedoensis var. nudiflora]|uniref:Uncharacterized protein n=1 Tax=Prunus yedoensis var. nudiflora TaxID=2094558 RepID=A0A314UH98_PRUYE|nr:hypothetical protein Pyn_04558 [Prunus yedoensis var. nudiflora]